MVGHTLFQTLFHAQSLLSAKAGYCCGSAAPSTYQKSADYLISTVQKEIDVSFVSVQSCYIVWQK